MKKIISTLFLVTFILAGCQTETSLGITPLDSVDSEVEEMISFKEDLQLIYYEEQRYIVFNSTGNVSAEFEEVDDTVVIHFDVENEQGNEIKQHIFELTIESEHEAIIVHVNGEMTPFDTISI